MNTKITFKYDDVTYTLEYDRNAIKQMEQAGLDINEFMKKPMLNIDLAFKGAFLKNHRTIKEKTIDEIYKAIKNKESLIATLVEMMNETYVSLLDDSSDDSGNIEWDIVGLKK